MWLVYLELFVLTFVAFGLGALLALLVVRLAVRRTEPPPEFVVPPGASTAHPPEAPKKRGRRGHKEPAPVAETAPPGGEPS